LLGDNLNSTGGEPTRFHAHVWYQEDLDNSEWPQASELKQRIVEYNEDDVLATIARRDCMEKTPIPFSRTWT